jgi:hypothetical protein
MKKRSVRRTAVFVGPVLVVGGCSSKGGTLSGKVSHKGKPVVWGTVSVFGRDNIQYAGQITPEGTYSVPNVPGGPVKIAVSSPNPDGAARGGPAAAIARGGAGDLGGGPDPNPVVQSKTWFAIPDKYADPQQSGLTGTVKGDTIINLDLP